MPNIIWECIEMVKVQCEGEKVFRSIGVKGGCAFLIKSFFFLLFLNERKNPFQFGRLMWKFPIQFHMFIDMRKNFEGNICKRNINHFFPFDGNDRRSSNILKFYWVAHFSWEEKLDSEIRKKNSCRYFPCYLITQINFHNISLLRLKTNPFYPFPIYPSINFDLIWVMKKANKHFTASAFFPFGSWRCFLVNLVKDIRRAKERRKRLFRHFFRQVILLILHMNVIKLI